MWHMSDFEAAVFLLIVAAMVALAVAVAVAVSEGIERGRLRCRQGRRRQGVVRSAGQRR